MFDRSHARLMATAAAVAVNTAATSTAATSTAAHVVQIDLVSDTM